MITVNGTTIEKDYVSPTYAARVWKTSVDTINGLIEQFGGPNKLRFHTTTNGGQMRINVEDLQKLFENNLSWPDNDIEAEIDKELLDDDDIDPDLDEPGLSRPTVPFLTRKTKEDFRWKISQNNKEIETWATEPTLQDLTNNFPPGIYRVTKCDMQKCAIVVGCKTHTVEANKQTDALTQATDTLTRLMELQRAINPPTPGNNSDGAMVQMLMQQNTALMGMFMKMAAGNGGGSGDILKTISGLKELGLLDGGAGEQGSDLISMLPGLLQLFAASKQPQPAMIPSYLNEPQNSQRGERLQVVTPQPVMVPPVPQQKPVKVVTPQKIEKKEEN